MSPKLQIMSQWLCCIEDTSPWTGFKLTTLVVIGSDCICSCKSNYHMITTTVAPLVNYNIFLNYLIVISLNPVHGEVSSIQHYVIKLVSDLRRWFSVHTSVFSTNETERHDEAEILFKVTLNTIIRTISP
jgi:hypothetical protein